MLFDKFKGNWEIKSLPCSENAEKFWISSVKEYTNDKYNLERFIKAQNEIYCDVIKQLKNGYKETHWIWYIFPQLKGLGRSEYSNIYGIENIEEAVAYAKNKILWDRYLECCNILLNLNLIN